MENIRNELGTLIEEWLASRRHSSLHLLSKLTGVSYSTVVRMAQREVEPTLKNAMLILPVLLPAQKYGRQAADLLLKYFPETGHFLASDDAKNIQPLEELADIENFSKEDFVVLSLAATTQGVSLKRVTEKLGERGAQSLTKLLNVGALQLHGDRYTTSLERFKVLGHEKTMQQITYLCESFDFDKLDVWGSMYRLKTEGLSDAAVLKIHHILDQASEDIDAILLDKNNHGPNVMGYAMVSTFLDNGGKQHG